MITDCALNSRNAYFIWGSEGVWVGVGDEDASRVVSQYAKRRVVDYGGLTSADVLSFYAQQKQWDRAARSSDVDGDGDGVDDGVRDVGVVVVDLRDHIVPGEGMAPRMAVSEEDVLALRAATRSDEVDAMDRRGYDLKTMRAAYGRVEHVCELNKTKEIEFCDRTSSLTQMMRGDPGETDRSETLQQSQRQQQGQRQGQGAAAMERAASTRHGGLPLMPSASLERMELNNRVSNDGYGIIGRISTEHSEEFVIGNAHAFTPSQAMAVPVGGGRKPKAGSAAAFVASNRSQNDNQKVRAREPRVDDELRPIRKVPVLKEQRQQRESRESRESRETSGFAFSQTSLFSPASQASVSQVSQVSQNKSIDSLDEQGMGVFSHRSQSLSMHEVWSFSEHGGALSPLSSEGGLERSNSLLLEHEGKYVGGLRHEGKVHRGIPQSFKSFGNLRLSSDSESEPKSRSWSRAGSLEEDITLGFDVPNSPLRRINRVPSGSFGGSSAGRGTNLLASSSYRSLRRQRSSSMCNLKSLAEDGDGDAKPLARTTSNSVHVVKDIHRFFNS